MNLENDTRHILTITGKSDGFGAQYMAVMSGFVFARYNNYIYRHTPFKHVQHVRGSEPELNTFTGFKSDEADDLERDADITELRIGEVVVGNGPEKFFTKSVVEEIRSMYHSTPKPKDCIYDIAIHIRRGDVSNENFSHMFTPDTFYIKLLNSIKAKYPSASICIYSEGDLDDFKDLQQENVFFNLSTDVFKTFHEMVTAPILFTCSSAFSRTAGILSTNQVYHIPQAQTPHPSWIDINTLFIDD